MSGLDPFREQKHTRGRGNVAEEEAVTWLEKHGYRILERNVRNQGGETLCFIEIKARMSDRFGPAVAAVSPHKQRRLVKAARVYLMKRGLGEVPCRFDVLGLDAEEGRWRHTLLRDAFQLS